jgi:hypothetical protein
VVVADNQHRLAVTLQVQAVTQHANADRQRVVAVTAQAQAEAASTEAVAQANMRATSEAATQRVGMDLEGCVNDGVFSRLVHECVASLPAQEL